MDRSTLAESLPGGNALYKRPLPPPYSYSTGIGLSIAPSTQADSFVEPRTTKVRRIEYPGGRQGSLEGSGRTKGVEVAARTPGIAARVKENSSNWRNRQGAPWPWKGTAAADSAAAPILCSGPASVISSVPAEAIQYATVEKVRKWDVRER